MSYKTKTQREAETKAADARLQILLKMFGNLIYQKYGIKGNVENDLKDFIKILEK